MSKITIKGMKFFSYHGCLKEEREKGTNFIVDLQIELDTHKAEISDNLEDALDYRNLYAIVEKEMAEPSSLLEHIAGRIINSIKLKFNQINNVKVTVNKLKPTFAENIEYIGVTIKG